MKVIQELEKILLKDKEPNRRKKKEIIETLAHIYSDYVVDEEDLKNRVIIRYNELKESGVVHD